MSSSNAKDILLVEMTAKQASIGSGSSYMSVESVMMDNEQQTGPK